MPFGEYTPLRSLSGSVLELFDLPMSSLVPGPRTQDLLTAQGQGLSASVGPQQFTVGSSVPPQNPNVDFTIDDATGTGVLLEGNLVKVPANGQARVKIGAIFAKTGTYPVSVSQAPNWTQTTSLPSSGQFVIQGSDMDPDGKSRKSFSINLTAPGTPSTPVTVTITGAEQGSCQRTIA